MELNLRQRRWLDLLKDYALIIEYHTRKANMMEDALRKKTMPALQNMSSSKETHFIVGKDGELRSRERVFVLTKKGLRKELLREAHQWPFLHHLGGVKMYRDLKDSSWWPSMKKEISECVSTCLTCQRVNAEHQVPSGMLYPLEIPEWK
ncbi:DNA/RNA polymerases superfamily protein [Gossypium australe]|uniref:DNA/RNA polymerases superfamily protein n=1 Tax=Gossypium australe TaxID=47621 RepID=A0A5B6VNW2_9ROSI|nr:DNA/RNA polymerases superfamily protein [Gossypium australe]